MTSGDEQIIAPQGVPRLGGMPSLNCVMPKPQHNPQMTRSNFILAHKQMVTGAQPAQNLMNSCSSALSLSDMEDRFKKFSDMDRDDQEVPVINDDPTLYELNLDDHENLDLYEKKVNPLDNMAQSQ